MAYRQTEKVQRQLASKKTAILRAARRLFAARGYEDITMAELAKAAGVSTGSIYTHFGGKEALFLAVVEHFVDELILAIRTAWTRFPPGLERTAAGQYAGVLGSLASDSLATPVLVAFAQAPLRGAVLERFTALLVEHFDDHPQLARGMDHRAAAHAWCGALFNLLEQHLNGRLSASRIELARVATRFCIQALGHPTGAIDDAIYLVEQSLGIRHDTPDRSEQ